MKGPEALWVPIGSIHPWAKNPRKITDRAVDDDEVEKLLSTIVGKGETGMPPATGLDAPSGGGSGDAGDGDGSGDDAPKAKKPGTPNITYSVVFDTEEQQQRWFTFLRWLKKDYPMSDTIAARLIAYLDEHNPEEDDGDAGSGGEGHEDVGEGESEEH
jgi:hypothetical protein